VAGVAAGLRYGVLTFAREGVHRPTSVAGTLDFRGENAPHGHPVLIIDFRRE